MTEPLASKTAHRVGDKGAYTHPRIPHRYCRREFGGVKREDDAVCRDGDASFPSSYSPSLSDTKAGETLRDLFVTRITQLSAEDNSLSEIFRSVCSHCHRERHFPSVTSFTCGVRERLCMKCLCRFRYVDELYLDRAVSKLVAANYLTEAITALLPLERREVRQLHLLAGHDQDAGV